MLEERTDRWGAKELSSEQSSHLHRVRCRVKFDVAISQRNTAA